MPRGRGVEAGVAALGPGHSLVRPGLETYCQSRGLAVPAEIPWFVVEHMDREMSTVTRIRADLLGGHVIDCFLKTFRPVERVAMSRRVRERIERAPWLFEAAAASPRFAGFGVPEVLSWDADLLSLMTLALPGRPLGKAWTHVLRPSRARRLFGAVGGAMSALEGLSAGTTGPDEYLRDESIRKAIDALVLHLPRERAAGARAAFESVHRSFQADPGPSYYCHGDVNHSNVLVDGNVVNLIDFDLSPRPVGFDVAMFLMRLELERPTVPAWTRVVSNHVLAGYGNPDVIRSPAYQLIRLVKLSGSLTRHVDRGNTKRAAKFLAGIESTLSTI